MQNMVPLAAPAALLVFYLIVRRIVRSERREDSVVVQYEPPDGLTGAELRLVWNGFTDGSSVAATLAECARKGFISISKTGGSFALVRNVAITSPPLDAAERVMLDKIFAKAFAEGDEGKDWRPIAGDPPKDFAPLRSTVIKQSLSAADGKRMSAACSALHEIVSKNVGKYYRWNFGFVLMGMAATLVFGLWNAVATPSRQPLVFLTVWFFFFSQISTAVMTLNATRLRLWRNSSFMLGMVVMWALTLCVPILVASKSMSDLKMETVASFGAMILLNSFFTPALRTMTQEGVLLKAKIAGYREFLESVAIGPLDRLAKDGINPTSDGHLAYAIALDLRATWGDDLETATMTATSMA